MIYPIVIHKDKTSDYGVIVPDLPGCFSAGRTLDEALAMAKEAIELHLEGLIEEGEMIPKPRAVQDHNKNHEYKGGTWALIAIEPASLRIHAKRVNVTIPERVLDAIDRAAAAQHETRSGLLTKAANVYIQKLKTPRKSPASKRWKS